MSNHLVSTATTVLSRLNVDRSEDNCEWGDVQTIEIECRMACGHEQNEITNTQNKGFR
jgi:hypothetical protein